MKDFTNNFALYLNYFSGREDYTAVQGEKGYYPINQSLDSNIVTKHIDGIETFGVYVLTKESKCNFICIDIDIDKKELSDVNFKDSEIKFEYLRERLQKFIEIFENKFNLKSENILFEETGGRGYHIWLFFEKPIIGNKAVHIYEVLKSEIDFSFEYFPKQSNLNEKRKFGNLIKLPLGVHKKYRQRSNFFTLEGEKLCLFDDIQKNIDHLLTIKKLNERSVDLIIEKYKAEITFSTTSLIKEVITSEGRKIYKKDINKLYGQCSAIRKLKDKALSGIELNHMELFHLSNTLLSLKDSKGDIESLLMSSLKDKYSSKITQKELSVIEKFKPSSCKTLINDGVCESYCKQEFKKRNDDDSLKDTYPIHSQVLLKNGRKFTNQDLLIEEICKIENIELAYYKLKEYHKNEDALFFDEFDFEFFEKDFDLNIVQVSNVISNNKYIPKINYEIVDVPKKIDENGEKVNRKMAYSSIFDQIIVQSVFNIIGEILENNFENNSYGYRLNVTNKNSYNIFENWRDKYPEFRNTVLNKLREPDIQYYICCDIKGYYDNIRKDILKRQIGIIIDNPNTLAIIENAIDSYSYNNNTELGLPQGPAYARSLANLYLNDFDKEIKRKANYYFRYVDDFYVLFDSLEKANDVKNWIVERLDSLELKLSDDVNKLAEIISANDESPIVEKIDSIKYGLFDDFKFLPNLDRQDISDFYNKIIQNTFNANDKNKEIPTLIYFGTSPKIDNEQQNIIIDIVEELADQEKFFPKKVKNIFIRLLDIYESTNRDFIPFFKNLDSTNKTYFLIAVYEKYIKQNEKYTEKINQVLLDSLNSDNQYLLGISLIICFKNPEINILKIDNNLISRIRSFSSPFLISKFLMSINYFEQSSLIKEEIDKFFNEKFGFLITKAFLSGIDKIIDPSELENILFSKILEDNNYYIYGECCRIASKIKTKGRLLDILVNYLERNKSKYKSLIDLLGKEFFYSYKDSEQRDLENLKILFEGQPNDIRDVVNGVIARINNIFTITSTSNTEGYNRLDSYNECYYYTSNENKDNYREIIPYYDSDKYDEIIKQFESLKEKSIFLFTYHEFYSIRNEIVLDSQIPQSYKDISNFKFSLEKNEDCFHLIKLINNVYKKAVTYFNITGKIPKIKNNIKIEEKSHDIIFTKIGLNFTSQYICNTEKIDNNNPDNFIKILSSYVFDTLFTTKNEFDKYIDPIETPKVGIQLFIYYIIKRLKSNNLSVEKISFLYNLIEKEEINNSKLISYLFFTEKLKINIFKSCEQFVNWKGVTNGLVDLYEDFALSYGKLDFSTIDYKNILFLNNAYPNLNYISKRLLNLNANLDELFPDFKHRLYYNYFIVLNSFSVYCLEILSVFKSILLNKSNLNFISENINSIEYDGLTLVLSIDEISKINQLIKLYSINNNPIYNQTVNFSLKEISILVLLVYFDHTINKNAIILRKSNQIQDEQLADLLINDNPSIENDIYQNTSAFNDSLRNHYRETDITTKKLESDNTTLIDTLFKIKRIQKTLKTKTINSKYRKKTNNKEFEIIKPFGSNIEIPILLINNNPFNYTFNNFEKDRKLHYERNKNNIFNILISDKKANALFSSLKKGKFLGYKFSLYYHNKGLLIWDIIIILFLFLIYIKVLPELLESRSLEIISRLFIYPTGFIFLKIFTVDLSYWFKLIPNFFKLIKERN